MVLVGLLPILAFAGSIQAAAIPVDATPPASPALSLHGNGNANGQGSSTFSPIPSFSPQLNVPSPTLPSAVTVPTSSDFSNDGFNSNSNFNGNGKFDQNGVNSNYKSSGIGGVGRGKGMTNAERMKRGLGILPPTRRMSSKPVRRSSKPVVDAGQFQSPNDQNENHDGGVVTTPNDGVAETFTPANNDSKAGNNDNTNNGDGDNVDPNATNTQDNTQPSNGDTNQDNSNNNGNDDTSQDDTANTGNGRVLASKKYSMRMVNPDDGSDMGLVTGPDGDDNPLIGYSPTPDSPLQMAMPSDPSSTPFSIVPNPSDVNNDGGVGNGDDGDDGTFTGPRKVLAAVPRRQNTNDPNSSDLLPGDANYAPLGMGWNDNSGLLHINIKALLQNPSSGLPIDPSSELPLDPTSGLPIDPSSGLPVDPSNLPTDSNTFAAPKQLLSRPGGSVLPITSSSATGGLPIDPSSGLPVDTSDPTHLLHAGIQNLPIGEESFGDPQSTIWTFHPNSKRLLAHYVNSDGNTVPTYFVTGGECSHTICLTGDVKAFKDAQGDGAHEVHVLAEAVADL